jgi:hypothetical protein
MSSILYAAYRAADLGEPLIVLCATLGGAAG